MRKIAGLVAGAAIMIGAGCTDHSTLVTGMFRVTARNFDGGLCTSPGRPTAPAVPDFELATDANHSGQLAYEWCDSPTQCDPIGSFDWFVADGDHFTRVTALVHAAPDNRTACSLGFDTLTIRETGANVHVDLLLKSSSGDIASCTPERAIAALENSAYCRTVDRYDLARL
jgi:hypothetical protein